MLRPSDFSKPYRTTNVVPYQMIASPSELPERGSSNGGVFHRGQIVWTREGVLSSASDPHNAVGFVEGLGHVLVDPRLLRLVDTSASTN